MSISWIGATATPRFFDPAEAFRTTVPLWNDHQDFDVFSNVDAGNAPPPLGVPQPGRRDGLVRGPATGRRATQGHNWVAVHPATHALLSGPVGHEQSAPENRFPDTVNPARAGIRRVTDLPPDKPKAHALAAVISAREVRAALRFPGNVESAEFFDVELTILYGLRDESTRDGSTAFNRIRGPHTHTSAAEELSPVSPWTAGEVGSAGQIPDPPGGPVEGRVDGGWKSGGASPFYGKHRLAKNTFRDNPDVPTEQSALEHAWKDVAGQIGHPPN